MHPSTAPVTRTPIRVPAGARPYVLSAPSTPAAPKAARDFVRAVLRRAPLAPLLDTAVLLTSEAVTRAHLHTPRTADIWLRLLTAGHGLRISVHDDAPARIPRPGPAAGEPPDDYGLLLTGRLADDWGTTPSEGLPRSTTLWFELRLPAAP
ncbi:ATP-binding protein [Streptomyces angustmyceticus]|uniref:ATP-binding protein n=1 Tax=Streptomyces angustmyceticus TaxID=285578 RepID=UPI0038146B85